MGWEGDVKPSPDRSRNDGRLVGSVFGKPGVSGSPDAGKPRYLVDCAGFIREIISAVTHAPGNPGPTKGSIIRFALAAHDGYEFLRAGGFKKFFDTLRTTPRPGWEAVVSAEDILPGDIVATDEGVGTHSGHIWICINRMENGNWRIIHSIGPYGRTTGRGNGGIQEGSRSLADMQGNGFSIGRLVDAEGRVA